jgi:hypothetical protein
MPIFSIASRTLPARPLSVTMAEKVAALRHRGPDGVTRQEDVLAEEITGGARR